MWLGVEGHGWHGEKVEGESRARGIAEGEVGWGNGRGKW